MYKFNKSIKEILEKYKNKIEINRTHQIAVYVASLSSIFFVVFFFIYGTLEEEYLQLVYLSPSEEETFSIVADKIEAALEPILWMDYILLISGAILFFAIIVALFTMKIEFPSELFILDETKSVVRLPENEKKLDSGKEKYCIFCGEKTPKDSVHCEKCWKKVKI